MYIVMVKNAEFGNARGNSKTVHEFATENEMLAFLKAYTAVAVNNMTFYKAERLRVDVKFETSIVETLA